MIMKVRSIQSHQVLSPKTRVNFEVDARSLPNVDQVELKGSFNPETGLFDPKWNEGKALPMRDDGKGGDQKAGDGIYEKRAGKGPRTISKDAPITAKDLKGKGRND